MDNKRALIVAGTHHRENEFSHSVADKLIEEYGKKEPDYFFRGSDNARQGRLWLYDGIAVAKIDKVGESSTDYLQTLSHDDLISLAYFKLSHEGCEFPPSIDGRFENINQWTSVSQQLVDASEAAFYIDLHSFHAYSQLDGIGLYILPDAEITSTDRMNQCLDLAKTKEPQIYGSSDHNPLAVQEEIALNIRDGEVEELSAESKTLVKDLDDALEQLDRHQLINLLRRNVNPQLNDLVSKLGRVNPKLFSYEAQATSQMAEKWGDLWYLADKSSPNGRVDRFTFEAVHWKGRQQNAVVNFISKYLVQQ
ncbi:MAG: hypothetical protein KAK00_06400 [Nanoarchaeota archaeon]|nr:hypothetical protein [Nanoarchaeota archaeon]